jgi:RDD family
MECRYCQTSNNDDDHRCRKCGRRLRNVPVYAGSSAAAPALSYDAHELAPVSRTVPSEPSRKPINYQPSLFGSRELPRVVAFETISPRSAAPLKPTRPASPPRQRPRKITAGQKSLEFAPATRSTNLQDGAIYCDAPVAIATHRALAAALDLALVTFALVILAVVLRVAGCEMVLNVKTFPLYLAAAVSVTIFYRALWCFAGGDSPGMLWAHLALINFDGQRPTRKQRFIRATSGFLSLAAAGLGLLWSLVDEETLTWHDHISKTFPTPR